MSLEDVLAGRRAWWVERGEALRLLMSLPDACVDAVITDMPYSSGGQFRGDRMGSTSAKYQQSGQALDRGDFAGDNRDQRSFLAWCTLWLFECLRVTKPGAPICLFTDWRQLPITTDAMQAGGWVWRGIVPWDKTEGARPCRGRFTAQCEYVVWGDRWHACEPIVAGAACAGTSPSMERSFADDCGYAVWGSAGAMPEERGVGCLAGFVRAFPKPAEKRHPAGKGPRVMGHYVEICEPGGLILDPFTGGGSTGIAARRSGRRFLGFELVPSICEDARAWLEADEAHSTPEDARAGQGLLFGV